MALRFKSIDAAIRYLEEHHCKVASVTLREGETLEESTERLYALAAANGYALNDRRHTVICNHQSRLRKNPMSKTEAIAELARLTDTSSPDTIRAAVRDAVDAQASPAVIVSTLRDYAIIPRSLWTRCIRPSDRTYLRRT